MLHPLDDIVPVEYGHNTQADDVGGFKDKKYGHFLAQDSTKFAVGGGYSDFTGELAYGSAQEHLPSDNRKPDVVWSSSNLSEQRDTRLDQGMLYVGTEGKQVAGLTHLFQREWSGSDLGILGLGGYGVYSLLIRA